MSVDYRPFFASLVPLTWSAEQALRAVHLLQQASAAIWLVHGEAMGKCVLGDGPKRIDEPAKPPRKGVDR